MTNPHPHPTNPSTHPLNNTNQDPYINQNNRRRINTSQKKPSLSKLLMMASAVPLSSIASMATAATGATATTMAISEENLRQLPQATFPAIQVYAEAEAPFKKEYLENSKYTQKLVDVPQTVHVITEELIEEQKAHSLVDALRNTPGITMQLGENGNSSEGDAISLRGFSGDDLFLVDGVRNIAPISRDTFNIEAVEVTKGSAGAELGRAATGGAINLITKKPKPFSDHTASISIDTEAKTRVSTDVNQTFSDSLAGRMNLMYEKGDAVGRDEVDSESWGIAPSITWGLSTQTRVTASAELLNQRNTPDGGISTIGMEGYYGGKTDYKVADLDFSKLDYSLINATTPAEAVAELNAANKALNTAPKVDEENYYGDKDDFEDVDSEVYSLFIEHDIDADTHLTNTTRYSKTDMEREMSAPYNAYNSPLYIGRRTNELQANEDLANLNVNPNNRDTWRIRTIRQGVDRENTTLANQTNINLYNVQTGAISHDISTGIEVLEEKQKEKGLSRPDEIDYPSLYNPNPNIAQGNMIYDGSSSEGKTNTVAGYVFDTVSLTDNFQIMGGARFDSYETTYKSYDENGTLKLKDNDTLISYKGALIFKPTQNSSLYANYSHTETPPGSSNFSLSNSGRGASRPSSNPVFDPQKTKNWEVGTKWELLEKRLLMTLAYYNTHHEDELAEVDGNGDYSQLGERKVEGIEFTAQGEITPNWNINFGIQTMDTEIKEGTSGRSAEGAAARWSPELTGTLWSSYKFNDRFTFGGGVRYVDEQKRQTDPDADYGMTNMPIIPDYWAVDAFASYQINEALSADLNVYNLFDEDYIDTLNNGGARVIKGEPLNAMLTLTYDF